MAALGGILTVAILAALPGSPTRGRVSYPDWTKFSTNKDYDCANFGSYNPCTVCTGTTGFACEQALPDPWKVQNCIQSMGTQGMTCWGTHFDCGGQTDCSQEGELTDSQCAENNYCHR